MSAPHAGGQLRRDQHEEIPYGFNLVRPTLTSIFDEIIFIHHEISIIYSQMSPEELSLALEMEMKKIIDEQNQMQPSIDETISEQQIIEDQIGKKKPIDNILFVKFCGVPVDS